MAVNCDEIFLKSTLIFGHDTGSLKDKALTSLRHQTIGFIFQSFNLTHLFLLKNPFRSSIAASGFSALAISSLLS